jgi:hypothetical protein
MGATRANQVGGRLSQSDPTNHTLKPRRAGIVEPPGRYFCLSNAVLCRFRTRIPTKQITDLVLPLLPPNGRSSAAHCDDASAPENLLVYPPPTAHSMVGTVPSMLCFHRHTFRLPATRLQIAEATSPRAAEAPCVRVLTDGSMSS